MTNSRALLRATRRLALLLALAALPAILVGQERVSGDAAVVLAPSFTAWRFKTALPNDSLSIKKVSQLVIPLSFTIRAGPLTLDAGGAYAVGRVGLEDGRSLDLSGFTDARVRGVLRVVGDNLLLTFGVNAPTGAKELAGDEIDALGVIGSPALAMPVPSLGNGFGATGGFVAAWRAGSWGLGFASSVETRARYTAIDALIAGVRAPTDLDPGSAYRVSFGADRTIGRGRLSVLVAGDFFGESRLVVAQQGGPTADSRYKLGPQAAGSVMLDLGVRGFRSFTISVADRYRSRFTGFNGLKAPGSDGNVFETSLEMVTGAPRKTGLFLRADGRFDSGLEVDNTITTAAMTTGGLSLGIVAPIGRASLQPFIRGRIGRLDTGPTSTTAFGFGGGIALVVTGSGR